MAPGDPGQALVTSRMCLGTASPAASGGRAREAAVAVCVGGLRLWSAPGLAGTPAAAALPGLEKEEAAGQAGGDAEEAGPGL